MVPGGELGEGPVGSCLPGRDLKMTLWAPQVALASSRSAPPSRSGLARGQWQWDGSWVLGACSGAWKPSFSSGPPRRGQTRRFFLVLMNPTAPSP